MIFLINLFSYLYGVWWVEHYLDSTETSRIVFNGKISGPASQGSRSIHYPVKIDELDGLSLPVSIEARMTISKGQQHNKLLSGTYIQGTAEIG